MKQGKFPCLKNFYIIQIVHGMPVFIQRVPAYGVCVIEYAVFILH